MTDLLELALADPERAWARAEAVVGESNESSMLSIAHQARGIVLRDAGRADEAVAELRTALRYAAPRSTRNARPTSARRTGWRWSWPAVRRPAEGSWTGRRPLSPARCRPRS